MKKLIFSAVTVGGIVFFLNSCDKTNPSSGLYVPTETDATQNATLEELQQGRELYIDNCANCHQLYAPDDFSPTRWNSIMASMAPKTSMTQSETDLALKYVTRGN